MRLVTGEELRPYFEQAAGPVSPKAQFLGSWDGRLRGVVAVWNYGGHDAEVGWAGEPGWLSRGFLRLVFAYLFGQLNLRRVTGRIASDNAVALAQAPRLGFVKEGTLRCGSARGDVIVFGMLREECRYGRFE